MAYNLWLPGDEVYKLGRRLRSHDPSETTARNQVGLDRADQQAERDMVRINALMAELAARLNRRRLEAC